MEGEPRDLSMLGKSSTSTLELFCFQLGSGCCVAQAGPESFALVSQELALQACNTRPKLGGLSIISALSRLEQENHGTFKASLGYTVSSTPAWTQNEMLSQRKNKKEVTFSTPEMDERVQELWN